MKKITLVLLTVFCSLLGFAQGEPTIVSTTAQNKKVILEEYTGVNCGYCPDGHRIAAQIATAHPDDVSLINIHVGGYAAQYKTQWGDAIANASGLTGYPAGSVNRHVFSGSATALDRGSWTNATNIILGQASFVNVAASAEIDLVTRQMNILVEVYYTGNADDATNKLNVAILQNNVLGPQSNMNTNPSQVVGSQYNHMHMLRHLVTGQWGETLNANTGDPTIQAGTFFSKTYTVDIPTQYGVLGDMLDVDLDNLEIVAFVAKGNQEVYTSTTVTPSFVEYNVPALTTTTFAVNDNNDCTGLVNLNWTVKNFTAYDLTDFVFSYEFNGTTVDSNFTAGLQAGASQLLSVANIAKTDDTQILNLTITNNTDTLQTQTVVIEPLNKGIGLPTLIVQADGYASDETTWKLKNSNGTVIQTGSLVDDILQTYNLDITAEGCYIFEIIDAYGDGMTYSNIDCFYRMVDGEGNTIFEGNGGFGTKATHDFTITTLFLNEKDVLLKAITTPEDGGNYIDLTSEENVVISVRNLGSLAVETLDITLTVDGNVVGTETWTGNIAPAATQSITLTNKADLSASTSHTIKVAIALEGETETNNNEITITITNVICELIELPLVESFNQPTFLPSCWTLIDNDGDGHNWTGTSGTSILGRTEVTGDLCAYSASYDNPTYTALTPSNYLITPKLNFPENNTITLKFWVKGQDPNYAAEKYSIKVSTTNNTSASAFTPVLTNAVTTDTWTEKTVDLSNYAGQEVYVAFVHENITDMYLLLLDDVSIEAVEIPGGQVAIDENTVNNFSIYPNPSNGLVNITVNEDSNVEIFDITGKLINTFSINANETHSFSQSAGMYFVKVGDKVEKLVIE